MNDDRIAHTVDGPINVVFAEGGCIPVEQVCFAYAPAAKHKPRAWSVDLVVRGFHRAALLELFEAGVSPLGPDHIIRFNIEDPIRLTYVPQAHLAARLDMVEDEASVVADASIHERVAVDALDLRNYEFQGAVQL